MFILFALVSSAVPHTPNGDIWLYGLYGINNATTINSTLFCDNSGNCANITTMSTGGGGSSPFTDVDNIYIWNNTGTITFNESKLNVTTSAVIVTDVDETFIENLIGPHTSNASISITESQISDLQHTTNASINITEVQVRDLQHTSNSSILITESQISDLTGHTNRTDADIFSLFSSGNLNMTFLNGEYILNKLKLSEHTDDLTHTIAITNCTISNSCGNILYTNNESDLSLTESQINDLGDYVTSTQINKTFQLNITSQACSAGDFVKSYEDGTFTCDTPVGGGGGGSSKWISANGLLSPNSSFPGNVNATGFITAGDINASNFYDDGVLLITNAVSNLINYLTTTDILAKYYNRTETSARFVNRTDWTSNDNYPNDCASGTLVIGLGDTLTCATDLTNTSAEIQNVVVVGDEVSGSIGSFVITKNYNTTAEIQQIAVGGDLTGTIGSATIGANSVALTTDTTGNYADGDGEAGNALTGDSATAFFSSGTIEDVRIASSIARDTELIANCSGATCSVTNTGTLDGFNGADFYAVAGDKLAGNMNASSFNITTGIGGGLGHNGTCNFLQGPSGSRLIVC